MILKKLFSFYECFHYALLSLRHLYRLLHQQTTLKEMVENTRPKPVSLIETAFISIDFYTFLDTLQNVRPSSVRTDIKKSRVQAETDR
jgi:hypothetical protein